MSLSLVNTPKFSVWRLPADTLSPPTEVEEFPRSTEEEDDMDPNSSLSMLGGTFAMWMFADDGNPSDQMELPPSDRVASLNDSDACSRPSALSLLHAVTLGRGEEGDAGQQASPHALALADGAYWRSLDEATRAMYGDGQGLQVGGALSGWASDTRKGTADSSPAMNDADDGKDCHGKGGTDISVVDATAAAAASKAALRSTLLDIGFAVVPSPAASRHPPSRGLALSSPQNQWPQSAIQVGPPESAPEYNLWQQQTPPPSSSTSSRPASYDWDEMARAVRTVEDHGWPPVFALMFDAPWAAVQRAWQVAAQVLGEDCALEPSIFVWSLRRNADPRDGDDAAGDALPSGGGSGDGGERKRCARVGENFGLPHRDFSYDEAHFSDDGRPRVLNVWIPLTEATADNGCLWVVPREFDPFYDKPDAYEHNRPATPGFENGLTKVRFPLGAMRPVPCAKGSVVCWHNVIHWGGACSKHAAVPRIALAATFKAKGSRSTHLTADGALDSLLDPLLANKGEGGVRLPLESRVRLIAKSLAMYEDWYDLDGGALPKPFFDMMARATVDREDQIGQQSTPTPGVESPVTTKAKTYVLWDGSNAEKYPAARDIVEI